MGVIHIQENDKNGKNVTFYSKGRLKALRLKLK